MPKLYHNKVSTEEVQKVLYLLDYAKERGLIKDLTWTVVKSRISDLAEDTVVSAKNGLPPETFHKAVELLEESGREYMIPAVALAFNIGLDKGDLQELRWEHYNKEENSLIVGDQKILLPEAMRWYMTFQREENLDSLFPKNGHVVSTMIKKELGIATRFSQWKNSFLIRVRQGDFTVEEMLYLTRSITTDPLTLKELYTKLMESIPQL